MLQSLLDFVLPRECPSCRGGFEGSTEFCPECEQEIQQLELAGRCELCAMPVTLPGAPCAPCQEKGMPFFDRVACLGVLKGPLKAALHRVKYEHRWPLAERLADRLLARQDVRDMLEFTDCLVPVPLHRQKQRYRGFNQAEVIAKLICKKFTVGEESAEPRIPIYRRLFQPPARSHLAVIRPASRVKPTESQTQVKNRSQRFANLKGAFELIEPDQIAGKHLVLIDDVLTSGATLRELARTLKPAKPASFNAIVVAVADPKGRAFEVI